MFEPIPNFESSLPRQIRRQMAIEKATRVEEPKRYFDNFFAGSTPVAVKEIRPQAPREYIFGLVREPRPNVGRPGTRRVRQPYIFVGGKRVSTGRHKPWSAK